MSWVRSKGSCKDAMSNASFCDDRSKWHTGFLIPAAHYKLDHFFSVQRILSSHKIQSHKSPIDGVQAQMRGKMVCKIILALLLMLSCEVAIKGIERTLPRD
jgi:hypothetical protein